MLKTVVKLKNVGLLRNGSPNAVPFGQVTLVYGENGRGKSTIATVLRAASAHDAGAIAVHKTIDSDEDPALELVFVDAQGGGSPVTLKLGNWTGNKPPIYVFDPNFVESNVFSGQEVRPDQRQSLLQFALGEESVQLEKELAALVPQIAEATKRESEASKRIAAFSKSMPVSEFIRLEDVPDAQAQIDALRSRIEAAKNAAAFSQRSMPEPLPPIELDIGAFFAILQTGLPGMRADARAAVQEHFKKHGERPGIEAWVTQGRAFATGEDCPYCGQDLGGADLMAAYDAYFSTAYNDLMAKVDVLVKGVDARLADSKLDLVESKLAANEARITAWMDHVDLKVPKFDLAQSRSSVAELRALVAELASRKQKRPLEAIGSETDVAAATTLLGQIRQQVVAYNAAVAAADHQIRQFLAQLHAESPAALGAMVTRLEAVIARRSDDACQAVADYGAAEAAKTLLTDRKAATREALDGLLPKTLSTYQGRINALLTRFGAAFEIVRLGPDYTGGTLRSNYALQLRGRPIKLGRREVNEPSFGRVLSEGDKRTLALAFFLAKVEGLPGSLVGTTVVFDDPMCSFDQKRRESTIASIVEVVARGAQVVVLCHDPYFLRDLKRRLERQAVSIVPVVHEIKRVQKDYSALAPCDLDRICESDYHRGHRIVREYVDGGAVDDRRSVAKELRPLMEGFLKQRFPPPLLDARANLGQIIRGILASKETPLTHAKQYVAKLDAVNLFDTKFHHNDGDDVRTPDDAELQRYARMTLEVIYGDYSLP